MNRFSGGCGLRLFDLGGGERRDFDPKTAWEWTRAPTSGCVHGRKVQLVLQEPRRAAKPIDLKHDIMMRARRGRTPSFKEVRDEIRFSDRHL